jgi:hypothetical protein
MHPLLARNRRFGVYLLSWIPLADFLAFVLHDGARLSWTDSFSLAIPLCGVYAFMCLSAWYSCKGLPLERTGALRLIFTHAAAAALISFVWLQLGKGWAYTLSRFPKFADLNSATPDYHAALPLLFVSGFLIYLLAVAYYYVILSLDASRDAETRVMETSMLARNAELKALKAQVNPHFLFNSLNSISALTSIDPDKAREMCILLAEFLRMTLGLGEKSSIPLGEELHLLERFLAIEKVRFGSRLEMREDIQEGCAAALIPALLLQPLVENAVTHGIANLLDGGFVSLVARCHGKRLTLIVENSCDVDAAHERHGGLGMANVRRRLETRYGKDADMRVSTDAGIFRVQLSLPMETATAAPAVESIEQEAAR